jgi:hypothetical protein
MHLILIVILALLGASVAGTLIYGAYRLLE